VSKVTLVFPPSPFLVDQKAFPPLGILYLAATLERNGIPVEVIDLANFENEMEAALAPHDGSTVYGISSTTPQYPYARRIKDILRQQNPEAKIVIGGAHASSVPERCRNDGFDVVVVGEGEGAILQIVHDHEARCSTDPILRLPYIKDLDSFPFPARHLIDIHSYAYDVGGGKGTTLITTRGCPYACAFCSKDVWSRGTRFHSVDYVVAEIQEVMERYGFRHFLFLDDLLTLKRKRLLEFCSRIAPLGIRWRCYARANTTTKEMLLAMKDAGCVEVGVGVESGSQKILDIVCKGTTVEANTRFVLDCKEVGILANVFIMIGLPGETHDTVEETRKWMEMVRPDKFGFNIFAPYVGTPIHNHPENYDIKLYEMPDERSWVKGRQGEYEAFVATSELCREEILSLFTELFGYYTRLTSWKPGVGRKETHGHGLSIIMPAYNEEADLEHAATKILAAMRKVVEDYQLVIVNDGSKDNTGEIADKLATQNKHVTVVHHPQNRGWGAAVKIGIAHSRYDLVMLSAVDNPFEAEEIARFLQASDKADVVVGFRTGRPGYKAWMRFGSRVYHWMIYMLFGLRLRDFNWIHLYNKKIFDDIDITFSGIVYMPEVLVKAAQQGYRIVEISSEMKPRLHGESTVSKPRIIIRTFLDLMRLWVMVRGPLARRKTNHYR
jgi:anaerobic magnesium-protoporphyrin IX monomethyl ester cyclase